MSAPSAATTPPPPRSISYTNGPWLTADCTTITLPSYIWRRPPRSDRVWPAGPMPETSAQVDFENEMEEIFDVVHEYHIVVGDAVGKALFWDLPVNPVARVERKISRCSLFIGKMRFKMVRLEGWTGGLLDGVPKWGPESDAEKWRAERDKKEGAKAGARVEVEVRA